MTGLEIGITAMLELAVARAIFALCSTNNDTKNHLANHSSGLATTSTLNYSVSRQNNKRE